MNESAAWLPYEEKLMIIMGIEFTCADGDLVSRSGSVTIGVIRRTSQKIRIIPRIGLNGMQYRRLFNAASAAWMHGHWGPQWHLSGDSWICRVAEPQVSGFASASALAIAMSSSEGALKAQSSADGWAA